MNKRYRTFYRCSDCGQERKADGDASDWRRCKVCKCYTRHDLRDKYQLESGEWVWVRP